MIESRLRERAPSTVLTLEQVQERMRTQSIVLTIAERDPLVLVLRTRKRTVLVLVLDCSSSIAASR